MSADVGVEYAKCSSIGQLMGCLMREYGIKPKKTDKVRDVPQQKQLLEQKNRECDALNQKASSLEELVHRLEQQVRLAQAQHESEQQRANEEVVALREKVSIFERTLQEEESFVGKLKDMLINKQAQVKQLVGNYERRIAELQKCTESSEKPQSQNGQTKQLRSEIHTLNALLREQQSVMVELLHRNSKLQEQVLRLQRKQQLNDSRESRDIVELDDSNLP